MTYEKIIDILLSDEVYELIKENEDDIFILIPELKICKGFNQNNDWHIYDVYEHILHVIKNTSNNKLIRLAALFHDIGKPNSYKEDENKIGHFFNHWNESINIFDKYKDKLNLNENEIKIIRNLIYYHDINIDKLTVSELKELLNKIGYENIDLLFELKQADLLAQSPKYHDLLTNINKQKIKTKQMM